MVRHSIFNYVHRLVINLPMKIAQIGRIAMSDTAIWRFPKIGPPKITYFKKIFVFILDAISRMVWMPQSACKGSQQGEKLAKKKEDLSVIIFTM